MAAAVGAGAAGGIAAVVDELTADLELFNGDLFVTGQQGEVEERRRNRLLIIRQTDIRHFSHGNEADTTSDDVKQALLRTLRLNYWFLIHLGYEHLTALRISYIRTQAVRLGLADINNEPAAHNVRYCEVERVPNNFTVDIAGAANNCLAVIPNFMNDVAWRNNTQNKVTNLVCIVAFFMRVRGHHYKDEFLGQYNNIWRKCLYEEDNAGISWQHVAHEALHFIYPARLDDFWNAARGNENCAGALVKRFDSFAAGTAAVGAIFTGANDLLTVFPRIREILPEAFAHITELEASVRANRWAGSINRRFYNAPDLHINEKQLGALAAVIKSALESQASTAALRRSPALNRVANNAPITGAVLTMVLTKATQDNRMVNAVLGDPPRAEVD